MSDLNKITVATDLLNNVYNSSDIDLLCSVMTNDELSSVIEHIVYIFNS